MDTTRQLHLAIVGLGSFGLRYIRSLRGLSGVDVTWVSDLDENRCKNVSEEFAIPHYTTDIADICNDPSVDAVVVVTPEQAHADVTIAALSAGKHAIVEKPLATHDADALAMIEAAERSGKLLMTGFLLRFDYRYAQLKQRLPQIGEVRNIYAYRNFDRSLFTIYSRIHSFIENAIHDIDIILWYVGSPVKRVHGFCRNTLGFENPDINWGVLEFENGAIAVLQTSWLYPPQKHEDLQWNAGIQVMGEHGVLELANDHAGFRANIDKTGILLLDQTGWAEIHGEPRGAFGAMLRHYMACLRGEATYAGTSPREALEAMRIARRLVEDSQRPERHLEKNPSPYEREGSLGEV
jgi:predicted dehydrogenase